MGGLFERRKSYSPEDSSPPVHSDQSQPRPQSSNPFERRASMLRPPFADAPKKKAKKQTMAPEVTTMLLQCLFNLTMTPASHIKLIAPDRMRILSWFLGAEMFKHRMLALRACVNVCASHSTHSEVCEKLLDKIKASCTPQKDSFGGKTKNWGEMQVKALSAILNLSANVGEAMEPDNKIPSLPRMKTLSPNELDELCIKHKIDHFAHPRFKLQELLLKERKRNIRHLVFESRGLLDDLLFVLKNAPDRHAMIVLKILINLSSDDDIVIDMVEDASDVTGPAVEILSRILQPAADILAGRNIREVREFKGKGVDPWKLARLRRMLKSRFQSVMEVWVYFDKSGNWSVSSSDVRVRSKRLAPETDGLTREEIVAIVDPYDYKALDPHEFCRSIAWHELPGDGKVVPLSRALEEAKTRRSQIVDRAVQASKQCTEDYHTALRQRRIQLRKEQMAARQALALDVSGNDSDGGFDTPGSKSPTSMSPLSRKSRRSSSLASSISAVIVARKMHTALVAKAAAGASKSLESPTSQTRRRSLVGKGKDEDGVMLPAIDNKRSPSAIPTFEMTAANVKTFTNSMNPRPGLASTNHRSRLSRTLSPLGSSREGEESPSSEDDNETAEDRRIVAEESQKIGLQRDLATYVENIPAAQVEKMRLALAFFESLSTRTSNHEKLVLEVQLLDVIGPLLAIEDEPYGLKEVAQRLRAEMGYELKERVEVLSEAVRAKMRVVTSKWCNGLLTASFNSWTESVRLQRVHTMTLLSVYRENCRSVSMPCNSSIGLQALYRFLSDLETDRLFVSAVGMNAQAAEVLARTLCGRNMLGVKLPVLSLVELREMEGLQTLRDINVADNDIRDAGLNALVEAILETEMDLLSLNVSHNHLTSAASPALCKVLEHCPLEELTLSKNRLQATGVLPMVAWIGLNETLAVLGLADNGIGKPAGQKLGAMLEANHVLEELDLSWNDLTGDDGEQLIRGLSLNRSVVSLSVSWNPLGPRVVPILRDLVMRQPPILVFHMEQCGFNEADIVPEGEHGEESAGKMI